MQSRIAPLATLAILSPLALAACGGPEGAAEYNQAGVKHFEEGRLDEAVSAYAEAIRLDPEFAAAYYNRGQAHFALGRPSLAVLAILWRLAVAEQEWLGAVEGTARHAMPNASRANGPRQLECGHGRSPAPFS